MDSHYNGFFYSDIFLQVKRIIGCATIFYFLYSTSCSILTLISMFLQTMIEFHDFVLVLYCFQVDPSGEVVLFSQGGCPWKEHLFDLENELQVETQIKFVLYPDQNGHWRVQCVPADLHSFQNRYSFSF